MITGFRGFLSAIAALAISAAPAGAQWALFSHHSELTDKTVVDVGEVSRKSFTTYGQYVDDPILKLRRWEPGETVEWVSFTGRATTCFAKNSAFSSSSDPALLMRDAQDRLYIAQLTTSLSSIKVEVHSAISITCPVQRSDLDAFWRHQPLTQPNRR